MKQTINIQLQNDVIQALDECAKELNRTRTELIEEAIYLYFDKLDEMIADKRIDDLKARKTTALPFEDVLQKVDMKTATP